MTEEEKDEIDEFVAQVDMIHIPEEFISAATITYFDGHEADVSPDEVDEILDSDLSLEDQGIDDIRFMLDIEQIRQAVHVYTLKILGNRSE